MTSIQRRTVLGFLGAGTVAGPAMAQRRYDPARPLIFLDLAGRVLAADPETGRIVPIVEDTGQRGADGVAISPDSRYIYWSNMGRAGDNDGSIQRVSVSTRQVEMIVPPGGTHTPKQLKYDATSSRLYWSDREGMRVMRCNPDGSNIETLVRTGDFDADRGDQSKWCVGMALHPDRGEIYWSQKGGDNAGVGVIKRCPMDMKPGETADNRSDIELLFSGLAEPIDMDIDTRRRRLYWSDRGDNTINRARLDNSSEAPDARTDREILVTGMNEAIGVCIDPFAQRLYYTSLRGELGAADLDGSNHVMLATGVGTLTGIAAPVGLAPIDAPFETIG